MAHGISRFIFPAVLAMGIFLLASPLALAGDVVYKGATTCNNGLVEVELVVDTGGKQLKRFKIGVRCAQGSGGMAMSFDKLKIAIADDGSFELKLSNGAWYKGVIKPGGQVIGATNRFQGMTIGCKDNKKFKPCATWQAQRVN